MAQVYSGFSRFFCDCPSVGSCKCLKATGTHSGPEQLAEDMQAQDMVLHANARWVLMPGAGMVGALEVTAAVDGPAFMVGETSAEKLVSSGS